MQRRVIVFLISLAAGCAALVMHAQDPPSPTFYRDVLPILQQHCQRCHRTGEIAPMPLVTFEQTKSWARLISQDVRSKRMPPWFADPCCGHFADDPSLTPSEIATPPSVDGRMTATMAGRPASNALDQCA